LAARSRRLPISAPSQSLGGGRRRRPALAPRQPAEQGDHRRPGDDIVRQIAHGAARVRRRGQGRQRQGLADREARGQRTGRRDPAAEPAPASEDRERAHRQRAGRRHAEAERHVIDHQVGVDGRGEEHQRLDRRRADGQDGACADDPNRALAPSERQDRADRARRGEGERSDDRGQGDVAASD
jgi:hypothetical protein